MYIKELISNRARRFGERKLIEWEEQRFEQDLLERLDYDLKYAKEGDTPLTPEQKAQVDAFWGKYSFAFKMPYFTAEAYMNRTGEFDPRFFPYGISKPLLAKHIRDEEYRMAFQNKAYLYNLYAGIKQPKLVCRKVEGIYYDTQFHKLTQEEAVELCLERLKETEIVIKPSGLSGGSGVVFLAEATRERLLEEFKKIPKLMVVQEALVQHPKMAQLNPSTVNTVRLTTWLRDDEVIPLAALIKVGSSNVRVDNYKHGGCLLGVNMDGTTKDHALTVDYNHVTVLPSGVDLSQGFVVPGFDNVLETAKRAHLMTPRIKLISWDIGIDEAAEAVIIEANHGGDFRMHQAVTGPLLGDLTEDFLDRYVLNGFCRKRANKDWNFNEYYDHVELLRYAGFAKKVVVPDKINNKPVTVICKQCFYRNSRVEDVVLSDSIKHLRVKAFDSCKNLRSVTGGKNLETMAKVVFSKTPKLPMKERTALRQRLSKEN